MLYKKMFYTLAKGADIKIGEDIIINDPSAYKDMIKKGSLGLGESYMDGKWDSPHVDVLIAKMIDSKLNQNLIFGAIANMTLLARSSLKNLQTKKHAPKLYETHYNAGNHLFESFLDKNMIYTCAYFQNTDDLAEAQLDKIRIIGEKLKLKPGDRVLDIGCGWGGTARILSEMFDVEVVGVADTPNQIEYAKKHNASEKVSFIRSDYRDIKDQRFDKIYNVGFLEAIGPKNFRSFMEQVEGLLEDDGIFLVHTIGSDRTVNSGDPWIDRYIFPNGVIPGRKQIERAAEGIFEERDFETFGKYYSITLKNWNERFNNNWYTIKDEYKEPGRFKRMMNYYFHISKATFDTGRNDLFHIIYTKPGKVKGYSTYRLPKDTYKNKNKR